MLNSYRFRRFKNKLFFILCLACVAIAIVPLVSILFEVIVRGASQINLHFLTASVLQGGIGPSIQGTLIMIGLTSLIGIPVGILSGVYLSEYGNNKYASALRVINNVLTQFPSIVIGITAFGIIIIYITGSYSPLAGAAALSFMLIPIVARTTEDH
jgi:phosphate transport system permease protein